MSWLASSPVGIEKLLAGQLSRPSRLSAWLAARLWNRRNAALNEAALACLELSPGDRVLEVGFGGGYLLERMAGVVTQGSLAGVDISPAMVAACNRRLQPLVQQGRLDLQCASAGSLPYPGGHFTRLVSVNSIFYWPDAAQALGEAWRVLETRGRLVLCFTLKASLEKRGFARHVHLYETEEVQRLMARCGFQDIQAQKAADRHREFACLGAQKKARLSG